MVRISALVAWLMACLQSLAQGPVSYHGLCHTPRGQLHVLAIVVRYTDSDQMKGEPSWPDESLPGVLPAFLSGDYNALFSKDHDSLATRQNLTSFYHEMSGGKFSVTGEVYPIQVPVTYVPLKGGNFFSRQSAMNEAAIRWITENDPGFDWARFDRRTNNPAYVRDNSASAPDGVLDYVVFIHRAGGGLTGMGSPGVGEIPGSKFIIRNGHTGIQGYASAAHQWEYFNHEFSHNLFNAPHYLGANRANGIHFYTQKGWGLMHPGHAPFFTTNAWEAWWLGWHEPVWITKDTLLSLSDFPTTGQSVAVPLPGGEILFLERHEGISNWDRKYFFADSTQPRTGYGLFAYIVSEPATRREAPQLNPFNVAHSNFIRMLHGRGNHDYAFVSDSLRLSYLNMPVFARGEPNPVAGQNPFQFLRADLNHNGVIPCPFSHGNTDGGGGEQHDLWVETGAGGPAYTFANTGDPGAPFLPGDVIGMDGKAVVTSYPSFDMKADSLRPYELFPVRISVEKGKENELWVRISLNDSHIRTDTRWAGELLGGSFTVDASATLTLNQSLTPNRQNPDPLTGLPVRRTTLRTEPGATVVVEGELILEEQAQWLPDEGSKITISRRGRIRIQSGAVLTLSHPGQLEVLRGGKITVEPAGQLVVAGAPVEGSEYRRMSRKAMQRQTGTTQP